MSVYNNTSSYYWICLKNKHIVSSMELREFKMHIENAGMFSNNLNGNLS